VRIDPRSGLLAHPGQSNAIFEIFKQGQLPNGTARYMPPDEERGYGYYGQPRRGFFGQSREPREVQYGRDPRDRGGYYDRNPYNNEGRGYRRGGFRRDRNPNDYQDSGAPPSHRGQDDSLF